MIDRFLRPALEEMSRGDLEDAAEQLRNLVVVQDVTLRLVISVVGPRAIHPIAHSQVNCCRAAYAEVTGEESLVPELGGGK
jgi:hypothetical protein